MSTDAHARLVAIAQAAIGFVQSYHDYLDSTMQDGQAMLDAHDAAHAILLKAVAALPPDERARLLAGLFAITES